MNVKNKLIKKIPFKVNDNILNYQKWNFGMYNNWKNM